jgi:hypothetical protein
MARLFFSSSRHKYQEAAERQGFQRSAVSNIFEFEGILSHPNNCCMPSLTPKSSTGKTSGLPKENIKYI